MLSALHLIKGNVLASLAPGALATLAADPAAMLRLALLVDLLRARMTAAAPFATHATAATRKSA